MTGDTYEQYGDRPQSDIHSEGKDCRNCDQPGFEHDRERVPTENGRHRVRMECPT